MERGRLHKKNGCLNLTVIIVGTLSQMFQIPFSQIKFRFCQFILNCQRHILRDIRSESRYAEVISSCAMLQANKLHVCNGTRLVLIAQQLCEDSPTATSKEGLPWYFYR